MMACRSTSSDRISLLSGGRYRTAGWIIRTAKYDDSIGREYKAGDIICEIKLERIDTTPFENVLKHPTAHELDDYAEYKRLRRLYREDRHHGHGTTVAPSDVPIHGKIAPTIAPANTVMSQLHLHLLRPSPSPSRKTTFKEPGASVRTAHSLTEPSPSSSSRSKVPSTDTGEIPSGDLPQGSLVISTSATTRSHARSFTPESSRSGSKLPVSVDTSPVPGKEPGQIGPVDITEVVPWIGYDPEAIASAAGINVRPNRQVAISALSEEKLQRETTRKKGGRHSITSSPTIQPTEGNYQGTEDQATERALRSKRKSKKPMLVPFSRSRNPLAKIFDGTRDGTVEDEDEDEDYFTFKNKRSASVSVRPSLPMAQRLVRSSSSGETHRPLSPIPIRPNGPTSPLITSRRDAIALPLDLYTFSRLGQQYTSSGPSMDDPFVDTLTDQSKDSSSSRPAMPLISLKSFITAAKTASPLSVSPTVCSTSALSHLHRSSTEPDLTHLSPSSLEALLTSGWRRIVERKAPDSPKPRIAFRNPFEQLRDEGKILRRLSSDGVERVPPEVVL